MTAIAQQFFSPEEAAALLQMPADVREQCFFRIWTRKEAFIKAVGEGLSIPLDCFGVTSGSADAAMVTHLDGRFGVADSWQLHAFEPMAGFLGALAYRGPRLRMRLQACGGADRFLDAER